MTIDTYMLDIEEKDGSSALLAELALPTLDREFVHRVVPGKNGLSFLKVPERFVMVGHSSGGDHSLRDPEEYAASVINYLIENTANIGAVPLAFANVIDAKSTDEGFAWKVGNTFGIIALRQRVAILNGELAKYGTMVNCDCNIAGTMLGLLERDSPLARELPKQFEINGTKYFVFDPEGKFVWMNSDGTGTKPLINSRFGKHNESVDDAFAMQADDKGKYGGGALAFFNLFEKNRNISFESVCRYADELAKSMGLHSIMQEEYVGNRLIGPHGEKDVYNISGTLVSLLTEEMINNMSKPKEGDSLIAIKGNGRSNGFTDRRLLMAEWFGNNWHETDGGRYFGEFLTKPSIIFYPIFAELIDGGLASHGTHMSGGAYRDKLSKLIAKYGLYVEIGIEEGSPQLFKPDPRECTFASRFNIKNAYTKYPMGNEGFIFTSKPEEVLNYLGSKGLEAKVAGTLEKRDDMAGVLLRAHNGDIVDFTVKKAA